MSNFHYTKLIKIIVIRTPSSRQNRSVLDNKFQKYLVVLGNNSRAKCFNQLVIKSPFINPLSTSVNKLDSSLARLIQTFKTSSCFNYFYFCTWCKFSRMSSMIKLFNLRDNTDWTEFSLINSVINYIFLCSVNNNWVLIFVKVT